MSIYALVKSTYLRCNALFNKRGKEVATMLASSQVYTQVLNKVIEDAQKRQTLTPKRGRHSRADQMACRKREVKPETDPGSDDEAAKTGSGSFRRWHGGA